MKIIIYYGGRGLLEDPMLNVLDKIELVLDELRVDVLRVNLYERKNQISVMPAELKSADGVILAASVEWFGIGGYLQQFLDACWLYADKKKMSSLYMMPVVISNTSGERDCEVYLKKAWELLSGIPCEGLCAYVNNAVDFNFNKEYSTVIEKKAEQFYRYINQKMSVLPSSIDFIKENVIKTSGIDLTPQESEQLSKYVSDDTYVKKQKQDIEELAAMFKGMLGELDNKVKANETQEKSKLSLASKDGNEEPVVTKPVKQKRDTVLIPEEKRTSSFSEKKTELSLEKETKEVVPPASKAVEAVLSHMEQHDDMRGKEDSIIALMRKTFFPELGFSARYVLQIMDQHKTLVLDVKKNQLDCMYDNNVTEGDVLIRTSLSVLLRITSGEFTFQRAFMSGEITAKGNFKTIRMLDQLFPFDSTRI